MKKTILFIILISYIYTPLLKANVDKTIAEYNGQKISLEEFNQYYEALKQQTPITTLSKKETLNEFLSIQIAADLAKKEKLDEKPELQKAWKSLLDGANARFRVLLFSSYVQKYVPKTKEKISDRDIKSFLNKNPYRRVNLLLVSVTPGASDIIKKTMKDKAYKIHQQLKKREDFSLLARNYSDHISAKIGGDLGYRAKKDMAPQVAKAIFKLSKTGDITEPIETEFGYHIFQYAADLTTDKLSRDIAQKTSIENAIQLERNATKINAFLEKMKHQAHLKVHEKLLQ